jgi:hypothetical protein
MGRAFWIAIIGGILGILVAMGVYLIAFNYVSSYYTNAAAAFVFSIVGIAGGIFEERKILGAVLMFIGAIGIIFSLGFYGILTFILFLVGAIVILLQKKEQAIPSRGADTQMDERKRYCKNCGAEIVPDSKYCSRCGTGQLKDNI